VTVNQVEEFHAKCEHAGVNKRVIVSKLGFDTTALKKAAHYGIDCLKFAEVNKVDWLNETEMPIRERNIKHADMEIGASAVLQGKSARLFLRIPDDGPDEEIDFRVVVGDGDQVVMEGRADALVQRVFKQVPDPTSDTSGIEPIEILNLEVFYFLDDEGIEHPVKMLLFVFHWDAMEKLSPLTFHHYGAEDRNPVFETVTTDIETFGD
jgi:hypothetical protein